MQTFKSLHLQCNHAQIKQGTPAKCMSCEKGYDIPTTEKDAREFDVRVFLGLICRLIELFCDTDVMIVH